MTLRKGDTVRLNPHYDWPGHTVPAWGDGTIIATTTHDDPYLMEGYYVTVAFPNGVLERCSTHALLLIAEAPGKHRSNA